MKAYSSRAQSTFQWAPYLFALPTMSLIGLFSLAPMLYGVWMSLQKVDVISGTSSFIGITNYIHRHPIGVLAKAEKKVVGMAL
jgi:ABC-type sugar transport system permease subunit